MATHLIFLVASSKTFPNHAFPHSSPLTFCVCKLARCWHPNLYSCKLFTSHPNTCQFQRPRSLRNRPFSLQGPASLAAAAGQCYVVSVLNRSLCSGIANHWSFSLLIRWNTTCSALLLATELASPHRVLKCKKHCCLEDSHWNPMHFDHKYWFLPGVWIRQP